MHRVRAMGSDGKVSKWYENSMRHVITAVLHGDWLDDRNERMYEGMFGVKLGFRYARISHVDFHSESDAIEFVLRWS